MRASLHYSTTTGDVYHRLGGGVECMNETHFAHTFGFPTTPFCITTLACPDVVISNIEDYPAAVMEV